MNLSGCTIARVFVPPWPSLCPLPSVPAAAGGGCTIYALLATTIRSAVLAKTAATLNRRNRSRTTIP
jgi:hypothetical protein